MSDFAKRLLTDLGIGLVCVVICAMCFGLFSTESATEFLRILSDCFFLAAVLMLATGGLTFTKNGGVWDGIGFSFKTAVARVRGNFEQDHMTFAQYREEREQKSSRSPKSALIAGVIYLALSLAVLAAYNMTL